MTEDEEFEALEQRLNMKEQEYEQINHPNGVTTWKTKPKVKPEALRLADEIEWIAAGKAGKETAAELRRLYWEELRVREHRDQMCAEVTRLHALNQELLEALTSVTLVCENVHHGKKDRHGFAEPCPVTERIRAVLVKAQGERK